MGWNTGRFWEKVSFQGSAFGIWSFRVQDFPYTLYTLYTLSWTSPACQSSTAGRPEPNRLFEILHDFFEYRIPHMRNWILKLIEVKKRKEIYSISLIFLSTFRSRTCGIRDSRFSYMNLGWTNILPTTEGSPYEAKQVRMDGKKQQHQFLGTKLIWKFAGVQIWKLKPLRGIYSWHLVKLTTCWLVLKC